jgi:hypothetical protein
MTLVCLLCRRTTGCRQPVRLGILILETYGINNLEATVFMLYNLYRKNHCLASSNPPHWQPSVCILLRYLGSSDVGGVVAFIASDRDHWLP